jgi:hypothetical protein
LTEGPHVLKMDLLIILLSAAMMPTLDRMDFLPKNETYSGKRKIVLLRGSELSDETFPEIIGKICLL